VTRISELRPAFVEHIPETFSNGVLYVSMMYATAVHLCCCGCGEEVVTTLSPTDWQMTFDGRTVSLTPSVGNWNLACQSHYWIIKNRVVWSGLWSKRQIDASRQAEERRKLAYFEGNPPASTRPSRRASRFLARLMSIWNRPR